MATLYITEYGTIAGLPATANGQVPLEPPLADYTVSIAGTSPPFQPGTRMVRLHCDATCSILIGPSGSTSATTNNGRFATNQTEFRGVPEGRGFVVSVVANV
jgi:hypothetical protein